MEGFVKSSYCIGALFKEGFHLEEAHENFSLFFGLSIQGLDSTIYI
jgi:hypothetical protein